MKVDLQDPEQPPLYTEWTGVTSAVVAPPSYTESIVPQGSPPSYESLFGRVTHANIQAVTEFSFVKHVLAILNSTAGFIVRIGILLAVLAAMIAMGSLHLHDCREEIMIPITLLMAGCVGVMRLVVSLVRRFRKDRDEPESERSCTRNIGFWSNICLFVFFLLGSGCVYNTSGHFQSDDKFMYDYCDYNLYWFAFWIYTAVNIFVFLFLFLACCGEPLTSCCRRNTDGKQ